MINIENTTAAERDIIANAMPPVMETILSAGRLLWDLQEEYFVWRKQEKLDEAAATRVGNSVCIAGEMIFDACAAFGIISGITDFMGAEPLIRNSKQVSQVVEVERQHARLYEREKRMGDDKRGLYQDIICNIVEQSDEKALAMLSAIIKEVGA
jgi:hypothetical protein